MQLKRGFSLLEKDIGSPKETFLKMSSDIACSFPGKEVKMFRPVRGQGDQLRFLITSKRNNTSSRSLEEQLWYAWWLGK